MTQTTIDTAESHALALDQRDPLRSFRDRFAIPTAHSIAGTPIEGIAPDAPSIYLTGNSLGCMPRAVPDLIKQELEDWTKLGVEGHGRARDPWFSYHEQFREPAARIIGANPSEAVTMGTLTSNLHQLFVSFYRPTAKRHRVVIEGTTFPSDAYAVASQLRYHGHDPESSLVRLQPREGEHNLRTEDIEAFLKREGDTVALVWLGAVNYLTGQFFDIERITKAAHDAGALAGFDLAHAFANVPLHLHDWNVDCAAWCTYKYGNGGPGSIAGLFVHERHHTDPAIPRFEGWWGNDPKTRFQMTPDFVPVESADAWQLSNPPILSMTPLKASFAIFDQAGMDAIRAKSIALTGYLESLIKARCESRIGIITPADPAHRGAQLSLIVRGASRQTRDKLIAHGIVVDFREPNVIRAAPAPLYNTYHDVWKFVDTLTRLLD